MAPMPAVKLLALNKEADPTLNNGLGEEGSSCNAEVFESGQCVWLSDFGPVSLYVNLC